jgi:predicted CXXCH cytochrome family protein
MTRKFALLLSFAVVVFMAANAKAQYSRISLIVNSYHDMSSTSTRTVKAVTNTQLCYYCHTPHQGEENTDAAVTTAPNGQTPLWNHYLSGKASYGVYSSASFDALGTDITDLGGAVAGSAKVSNLCLSCHDGTVGVNTLYKGEYNHTLGRVSPDFGSGVNTPVFVSSEYQVGSDTLGLRDEHPINFTYDAALAAKSVSLVVPITDASLGGTRLGFQPTVGNFLPLFDGQMQCATCHDVHDNTTYKPFLRASTDGSSICLACHGK